MSGRPAERDTRTRRRCPRGFGLIEVIISGSLLLIGLAGVVQFAGYAEVMTGHQQNMAGAVHVAEKTMEELLLLYPDDARLGDGPHTGSRYDKVGNGSPTGLFATTWTVAAGVPLPGARTVEVTVTWIERAKTKTTRLRTIRT
ncbi:MAG: hypothetical protein Q8O67_16370 [Deltaproteobacteria bacterium]|nr:hypothetical protein [Deltaproteobacteria bacterium]